MVPITGSWEGGGLISVINVLNKGARLPRSWRLCRDVMLQLAALLPAGTGLEEQPLWLGPRERDAA